MRLINKLCSTNSAVLFQHARKALKYATFLHSTSKMTSQPEAMLNRDEVAAMRITYKSHGLKMDELKKKEPFSMFDAWFRMAKECTLIKEANAMSLATVSEDGKPSVRVVLLKGYGENGLLFFTNYNSRKGKEIEGNPNVAVMFYWEPLERQVRIEGKVHKLPEDESTSYFKVRPRASQLGALASSQSSPIPDKEFLEEHYAELEKKYEGGEIPKPDCWGGYQLVPEVFEFWCGGKGRMHDRVVFSKQASEKCNEYSKIGDDGWSYQLISP